MSDLERLWDLLGANTIAFRAELNSARFSRSKDENTVNEFTELSFRIKTIRKEDDLKTFTDRYREGWLALVLSHGEKKRNDKKQRSIGALRQNENELDVRVLVSPTNLIQISTLVARSVQTSVTISVTPVEKFSKWDGNDWLFLREYSVLISFE